MSDKKSEKSWLASAASSVGSVIGTAHQPGPVRKILRKATHPLLPDDYTSMLNPMWSSRELRGKVVSVKREADDVVTLDISGSWGVTPHYEAGQYIGIGVLIDGRWTWRSYSLTSVPTSEGKKFSVTVKAVKDGKLSQHVVHSLQPGVVIRLAAPAGDFVLPTPPPQSILFISAGSGITPIMGHLRTLDRRHGDNFPNIIHIHTAREEQDLLFGGELERFSTTHPGYSLYFHVTSQQGRIDFSSLSELVPDWKERHVWACGPQGMLDQVTSVYAEVELRDLVHTESFTIDRNSGAEGGSVTYSSSGKTVNVDGATTVLEAGEQAGVALPFGCRMGICQTCVVGVEQGYVRDLRSGQDHGPGTRVQTCVSVACGDVTLTI